MATALFAWQLGAGLGHMIQMLPLAEGLSKRGHRVFMALRNLRRAAKIYRGAGVSFLQAPAKGDGVLAFPHPVSFAQLLGNTGFGQDQELFALACAWRNLFQLARPDLIVFDHSPIALLSARGLPARRALIGTGFWCPPDVYPLPVMRSASKRPSDPIQVAHDEQTVLHRANWVLSHWKQPPLERLGQLYGEVDESFLTTFAEFDPFPNRVAVRYWGPVTAALGDAPQWPSVPSTIRIYAYLKPFAGLDDVLEALRRLGHPTLIYYDGINAITRQRFESDALRFVAERVDPRIAARDCKLAILNGTPGATCDVLLAGKPILQIPIYCDQERIAADVVRMSAGISISPKRQSPAVVESALRQLIDDHRFTGGAQEFAKRHANFDRDIQRTEMLNRACELLPSRDGHVSGRIPPLAPVERAFNHAAVEYVHAPTITYLPRIPNSPTPIIGSGINGWTFG